MDLYIFLFVKWTRGMTSLTRMETNSTLANLSVRQNMDNSVFHMFIVFPLEMWNLPLCWLCICSWSIPRSQKALVWFKTLPYSYSRKLPPMMCFIPIHLERSTLTLHVLSIFYPCCCYLMHIPTTMQMLHPLHGRAGIYHPSRKTVSTTRVSKKWSKRTNWFSSSFVWNRMRRCGNNLAPRTRRVINWDGRLGNLTVCGLQVWDMSVSLILAFLLCSRITKTCTRKQEEGINVDSPLCNSTTLSPKVP